MNTVPKRLFGRKQIFTSATEINRDNVLNEVTVKALTKHEINRGDIEYLYNYYKGDQPILYRVKEIREDICNMVVENHAQEIVAFKTGYLCGSPIQYISANSEESVSESINTLNSMMRTEGKAEKDKALIEWDMICGTAYRMILPDSEYEDDSEDAPFEFYTLDPRNTFIIYSNDVAHKPLAGVYYVVDEDTKERHYSVYTKDTYFEIVENKIVSETPHALTRIPIIEYPANTARMGAFESVLSLLDAINTVDSNRIDGIEQFIQSLVILYNCTMPDGEDASSIRAKGLIELKSVGENKADIKILSEQLNQTETQTLKDDLYQTVLMIVGMPSQGNGNTSDSSNNGAVILKNGWQGAEARAKDSELMFKESEQEFLKLVMTICGGMSDMNIKVKDIDVHFTRRNYEDILAKSQVLTTMLATEKVAPKLAFQVCGLFIDSEEAYRESVEYMEEQEKKAQDMAKQFAAQSPDEEVENEDNEPTTD